MSTEVICNIIEEIKEKWLREIKTELAGPSIQESLKIFTELMFTEPAHFVLELLQNAEDARMELKKKGGFFSIKLFRNKVEVRHNGKPFDEGDVRNLCKIGSSKKPKEGYKGYIGIGWKSVYRVSDEVHVYSGNYAFKFDKKYWENNAEPLKSKYGIEPSKVPWQVIPICIKPTEYVPRGETLIVVYFNDPRHYYDVSNFLQSLKPYMFLFLEYISRIEIEDVERGVKRSIEWATTSKEEFGDLKMKVEKVLLCSDGKGERLLIFRRQVKVPSDVKEDRLTRAAKRNDVDTREIALVFAIDINDNLKPIEEAAFWGVYSFIPLLETSTGLNFLIQADLIVHPGRASINYEALWNKWLMKELAELVRFAIRYLSEKYGTTYLSVFDCRYIGGSFYEKLVKPYIVSVIEEELKDPIIPCIRGHRIPLSKAVVFDEEVRDLIEEGLFDEDELKYVYNEEGLHLVSPSVKLRELDKMKVKRLKPANLMKKELIEAKLLKDRDRCLDFLAEVYRRIKDLTSLPLDGRYVLTKSFRIIKVSDAYISELPEDLIKLSEQHPEVRDFLDAQEYVHETLANKLGIDLLQKIGVRVLKFQEVAEKVFLPKIKVDAEPPDKEKLKILSLILKQAQINPKGDIWVIARRGVIAKSSEVYYPLECFEPIELYERLGVMFLDLEAYNARNKEEWKSFFSSTSIKGLQHYEVYDFRRYIHRDYRDLINKVMKKLSETLDHNDLITYTRALKKLFDYYGEWYRYEEETQTINGVVNVVVVSSKGENISRSDTAYLHTCYKPKEDWMKWRDLYEIGPFISNKYMKEGEDPESWRRFLVKILRVKEEGVEEHVERFAELYVKRKLEERGFKMIGEHGEGYDYEVKRDAESILVEVKGRRSSYKEVTMTIKETRKAIEHGKNYWLIVVSDIPNNPKCYVLSDLGNIRDVKLTVPHDIVEKCEEMWS